MKVRRMIAVLFALALPALARAQDSTQFDFLLGVFELKVTPQARTLGERMHGVPKLSGSWKARQAAQSRAIEDELRIVDEAGNTRSATRFLRTYDKATKSWKVSTVDSTGAAVAAFRVSSEADALNVSAVVPGTDRDGKAYLSRGRFTEISANAFSFLQERSYDGGRKWELMQRIDGKRTAAAMHR